jgi:hypothetical protein
MDIFAIFAFNNAVSFWHTLNDDWLLYRKITAACDESKRSSLSSGSIDVYIPRYKNISGDAGQIHSSDGSVHCSEIRGIYANFALVDAQIRYFESDAVGFIDWSNWIEQAFSQNRRHVEHRPSKVRWHSKLLIFCRTEVALKGLTIFIQFKLQSECWEEYEISQLSYMLGWMKTL